MKRCSNFLQVDYWVECPANGAPGRYTSYGVAAQTGARIPQQGDVDVYLSFFAYQDGMSMQFAKVDRRNEKAVQRFLSAVLKDVPIAPVEFDLLTGISRSVLGEVSAHSR